MGERNTFYKEKCPFKKEILYPVFRAFPASAGSQWPLAQNNLYVRGIFGDGWHILLAFRVDVLYECVCVCVSHLVISNSLQSHGCCLPGSSVRGILQARILEWVAIPLSRGSSQPRDQTWVSHIAGRFFTIWTTREAPLWSNWEDFTLVKYIFIIF